MMLFLWILLLTLQLLLSTDCFLVPSTTIHQRSFSGIPTTAVTVTQQRTEANCSTDTKNNEDDTKEKHHHPLETRINDSVGCNRKLAVGIATFLILLTVNTSSLQSANAAAATDVYIHDYADPLHPRCERHIRPSPSNSDVVQYTGTRVDPPREGMLLGCSTQEILTYGALKHGAFEMTILSNGAISAGDDIHEGVWEPAVTNDANRLRAVDGIRWNDGNKWTVMDDTTVAETSFTLEDAGKDFFLLYIIFSIAAGGKELLKRLSNNT